MTTISLYYTLVIRIILIAFILLATSLSSVQAQPAPSVGSPLRTRIELHYDTQDVKTANGNLRRMAIVPYTSFNLNDVIANEQRKIVGETFRDGVIVFDFDISHPLYDIIHNGGRSNIPFYVYPGDTLIIRISPSGQPLAYTGPDSTEAPCANMLLHDVSYDLFYTDSHYQADRQGVTFPRFVERLLSRMDIALDSINSIADRYDFSETERQLATNNIRIQFATWAFRYTPPKSIAVEPTPHNKSGEQTYEPAQALADMTDAANYQFVRQLPLADPLCLASRFFPEFIDSYESSSYLTSGGDQPASTSLSAIARADSSLMARDRLLTGSDSLSIFMDVALRRRHYQAPTVDDGSIQLADVQVIGTNGNVQTREIISAQDQLNARLNNSQTYDILSPTYWLEGRKAARAKQRAQKLIKQIEAEEQREKEECEAVEKASKEK